ncbi:MAG: hypothetical protein HYT70_01310 [Candidatus Aenigmarchaeota archaeon]|nr:hypothetical protein [Candidatus Aenigmarchaeota archaeon]
MSYDLRRNYKIQDFIPLAGLLINNARNVPYRQSLEEMTTNEVLKALRFVSYHLAIYGAVVYALTR